MRPRVFAIVETEIAQHRDRMNTLRDVQNLGLSSRCRYKTRSLLGVPSSGLSFGTRDPERQLSLWELRYLTWRDAERNSQVKAKNLRNKIEVGKNLSVVTR